MMSYVFRLTMPVTRRRWTLGLRRPGLNHHVLLCREHVITSIRVWSMARGPAPGTGQTRWENRDFGQENAFATRNCRIGRHWRGLVVNVLMYCERRMRLQLLSAMFFCNISPLIGDSEKCFKFTSPLQERYWRDGRIITLTRIVTTTPES